MRAQDEITLDLSFLSLAYLSRALDERWDCCAALFHHEDHHLLLEWSTSA